MSASALFAAGSTVLLIALLAWFVVGQLVYRAQWAEETLQTIEPRFARLVGLQGEHERLQSALAQAGSVLEVEAYPVDFSTGRAGADMQQRLRAVAEKAGLTVVNSRVGSAVSHEGFEEIPLSLLLEGSLGQMEALLRGLPELRPRVRLQSISVSPVARRTPTAEALRVEITVSAARLSA